MLARYQVFSSPDSIHNAMGVCEAEAQVFGHGLLQSSRFTRPLPDFEDARVDPSQWAQLLLTSSHEDIRGLELLASENKTSSAAAVEGVSANKAGDLVIFLSSLGTNIATVLFALLLLATLRRALPLVFSRSGSSESSEGKGFFSWICESWSISKDEVEEKAGLDHAMHLEFLELAMRLCVLVGLPCVLILCPLHAFCGGGAAGQDRLSTVGMGNVQHGSWICWVHAFLVWYLT